MMMNTILADTCMPKAAMVLAPSPMKGMGMATSLANFTPPPAPTSLPVNVVSPGSVLKPYIDAISSDITFMITICEIASEIGSGLQNFTINDAPAPVAAKSNA
jgi:hypothetical protein